MTPDQLPAGLPMDDKIEAWRHGLLRLVLQHARAYADNSDPAKTEAAYVAICDYLRTTPEGYRLVDQRENEALRKDAERYRWLRRKMCFNGNGDGTATMHAINLPNATKFPDVGEVEIGVDAAIDAALQEQRKC